MKTVLTDHQKNVLLAAYGKLHDGLSEMIEEGRLREADIPDDYQWLVKQLTHIAGLWGRYKYERKERTDG
jgi:hypothetical protein